MGLPPALWVRLPWKSCGWPSCVASVHMSYNLILQINLKSTCMTDNKMDKQSMGCGRCNCMFFFVVKIGRAHWVHCHFISWINKFASAQHVEHKADISTMDSSWAASAGQDRVHGHKAGFSQKQAATLEQCLGLLCGCECVCLRTDRSLSLCDIPSTKAYLSLRLTKWNTVCVWTVMVLVWL